MTNIPVVSVVLPFFNAESTLDRSVQSILDQSFKDLELILIDNNSEDHSGSIAERHANKDSRVTIIKEHRHGVVFAANAGLKAASGKYIARMDADDYSFSGRIEDQVRFLEENKHIGLVSGRVRYNGDAANKGFIRYVDWLNGIADTEQIRLNQFAEYPIVNPSILMRKELYKEYGGYREGVFPEDYEYFLRLQEKGVKMGKTDSYVLEWVDSPDRLTRTHSHYSQEAFFRLKAEYLTRWLKKNNPCYPDVVVWGAGRQSRRRSRYLTESGINIIAYIDVKDSKKTGVIHFEQTGKFEHSFILSYVSSHGAREEIRQYLNDNGFSEGVNYLICG